MAQTEGKRGAGNPAVDLGLKWDDLDLDGIFRGGPESPRPPVGRDKYKILLEISKALSANLVLEDLLVDLVDTVLSVTGMEKGFLLLGDGEGRYRVEVARDRERRAADDDGRELSWSVIREVIRTARPLYIADIEKKLQGGQGGERGPRAIAAFPLCGSAASRGGRRRGAPAEGISARLVGLIYVETALTEAEFPGVDLEFVEALAAHAAVAIENARLYQQVDRDRLVLADENRDLRREVEGKYAFENVIGRSERMRPVFDLIARVSRSPVSVLLLGESGTGKEVVAKTIHYNSDRRRMPFVSINCAALPESLLESELFGIEKGVATGVSKRLGKFEQANGGTFFLDEIGEMSLALQAKLLRVLENREIERVGGKETIPVDLRLIAATNRDLELAIREGRFREDLYFRLNVLPIRLPPLRERSSDIPALVEHFLGKHARPQGREIEGLTREALDALMAHDWPGNVRELENVIQRAILMCDGNLIDIDDLPPELVERREQLLDRALDEGWTADRLVREFAARLLKRNKGNLARTARELRVDPKTLKRKLDEPHGGR